MSVQTDPFSGRVTYHGTGIGNERAAKNYLKRKFRQFPLQEPVLKPGARFYVTVIGRGKWVPLLGPYASHMMAQMNQPRGKRIAEERDHYGGFYSFGTASSPDTLRTAFGR